MKLHALLVAACFAGSFITAQAQAPTDAPAGSTVQCKDGSFASPDKKAGACRGHKGIKTWFGSAAAGAATAAAAPAAAAAPTAPAPAAKAAPMARAKPMAKSAMPTEAAAGGGAGKVWANDESRVYHCMGDRYYGKTKKGEYMSEADAKAKGMHASHNKACS